jgi:hypothetical protein
MRQIVFLLLMPFTASAQTVEPENASSIEGRVLNSSTGAPVGKAALVLMRVDSAAAPRDITRSFAATSDAAGKFVIRNIDPGKYRLRASRNGFATLEYGSHDSQRPGTVLDLKNPQVLRDIEIRLNPQSTINGRILDVEGEPLLGAQVQLLRWRYINGKKVLFTMNTAYTNDLGEYRWSGLTNDKYYIYAEVFEGLPPTSEVTEDYIPAYYPGAATVAGAIPIDVAIGAQIHVSDMMLRKAPTATVRGRVVIDLPDAHGTPSVRFSRRVTHNNSSAGSFRAPSAKVDAAGGFEISNITLGSYTVMAEVSVGGRGLTGRTTVDVTETKIEGIAVNIRNGVSLAGRIRVDGEGTTDLQNCLVRLQRGGPTGDSTILESTNHITEDRTFRIENLDPDRYGLLIDGLPDGFWTKSIRINDVDVTYSGVDLRSGATGQLDILVSPTAGFVSGAVQNPNTGQLRPGAIVVLVPKEKERLALAVFYRHATSDQFGRFSFKNIVPGEYKVYGWEDVELTAWMDPDFMDPLKTEGTAVTVRENAKIDVQVSLILADSENEKPK